VNESHILPLGQASRASVSLPGSAYALQRPLGHRGVPQHGPGGLAHRVLQQAAVGGPAHAEEKEGKT
jgi:hypothetical protein